MALVALLSACADTHQLTRAGNGSAQLNLNNRVYIAVPKDGSYGSINYQGSGMNSAQIILIAFARYLNDVETGHQYQPYSEALDYAKTNTFDYLIYPTVLAWEDRATEWSGMPDNVSIKIAVVDTATGRTADSAT